MEIPTTRATLIVATSSHWKSQRLLQGIMWFRIVLDEAHWIRNTTSQQFKAVRDLKAQRRWCLSGTPIQNSLDDLRSLLAFLHFEPFSEPGFFRKHIVEPLHVESLDPFRNLRLLLRTTCFRRTAELLCLPSHKIKEIAISLTEAETNLYKGILDRCKDEFEEISYKKPSRTPTRTRFTVLLTATISLRRLCNHGTFIERQNPSGPQIPKRQGKSAAKKKTAKVSDEPMCSYCYGDNADFNADMDALEVCPECLRVLDQGKVTPSTIFDTAQGSSLEFSSKLNAVVENIRSSPSSKHIVFTSWRLTLDILQHLLAGQGVPACRIDGRTSFAEREIILGQYTQEGGPGVLLLSIATGAVGLTLTVADRVHIVEPQWNPSVEEQAIGRALRIGQQRNVTIYKYIANGTVEENIVFLQKRKSHLAKVSFDGHAGTQEGEKLDDMLFVLQRGSAQHRVSG
ncbi:hypothetical protein PG993_012438 [Apiospora rasikravindrae]|uniref:Uncharacterized protein n=1 Tax=Apiospora rasikravindrae TaxID=990691 RepID=A0ABR1S2D8_9PEZI